MKGRVSKINQVKEYVSKNDQLQCIRIAVERFIKWTLSLYRFLKLAFVSYRFFIGEIEERITSETEADVGDTGP